MNIATCDHCGEQVEGDDRYIGDYLYTCSPCCRKPCTCCDPIIKWYADPGKPFDFNFGD